MTVTIKTTDISSNQEWTSDPTMVEIIFNANFYQMALKWIAIMQEENISYLCRYSIRFGIRRIGNLNLKNSLLCLATGSGVPIKQKMLN